MTGIIVLLAVMLILIVSSVYYGMYGNIKVDVLVEINMLDSPYYNLGVSYDRTYEDGYQCIDRLTIGLVLMHNIAIEQIMYLIMIHNVLIFVLIT